MTYAALIILAVFGVMLQVAALTGQQLRRAQGCICRKGAVHPRCPLHGWES